MLKKEANIKIDKFLTIHKVSGFEGFNRESLGTQFIVAELEKWLLEAGCTLWIAFEKEDASYSAEVLLAHDFESGLYSTAVPDEIMAVDGEWIYQIKKKWNYDPTTGRADRVIASPDADTLIVKYGIRDENGNAVTETDLTNLYETAVNAVDTVQSAAVEAKQDAERAEEAAQRAEDALTFEIDDSEANQVGVTSVTITETGNLKFSNLKGEKGDKGDTGEKGDKGDTGNTGNTATIKIGTIETLPPGEKAYLTNVGTENEAIINGGIPTGPAGQPGATNLNGKVDLRFYTSEWTADTGGGYRLIIPASRHGFGASRVFTQVDNYSNNTSDPLLTRPVQLPNGDLVLYSMAPFEGMLQISGGSTEIQDVTARQAIESEAATRAAADANMASRITDLEIREDERGQFLGAFSTTAALLAFPSPTENSFADNYQTETRWIYESGTWTDTGDPYPVSTTLLSDGAPLMDGATSAGTGTMASRQDHVHPKDTTKVDKTTTVNGKALNQNITLNKSDIGLGNVQNVDQTNASNITSGTLSSARLEADAVGAGSANVTVTREGGKFKVSVAAGQTASYKRIIATTDWQGSGTDRYFTVPATTHGMGANCKAEIRNSITKPYIDDNGNVTVYSAQNIPATLFIY